MKLVQSIVPQIEYNEEQIDGEIIQEDNRPNAVQEEQLTKLLRHAELTYFGSKANFSKIRNYEDFKKQDKERCL